MAGPEPDVGLAERFLPPPLHRALTHLFAQGIEGCMLVGGTALAGYYAGHRRSDDLDLFTRDPTAQRVVVLALGALDELGARRTVDLATAQFNASSCSLDSHDFTIQVVLDPHLFEVGTARKAGDGVAVAELPTLLAQKTATLVSRCSEKDLYDLRWLLPRFEDLDLAAVLEMGRGVDGGVAAESVLISLAGAQLSEAACGFSSSPPAAVLEQILELKVALEQGCGRIARNESPPRIAELVRALGTPRGGSS